MLLGTQYFFKSILACGVENLGCRIALRYIHMGRNYPIYIY